MFDLTSIIQSIYSGLAKDLVKSLHRSLRRPFEWPEKEQAIDRCLKIATEDIVAPLKEYNEKDGKLLAGLLEKFFDHEDTVRELNNILINKPLKMKTLVEIFEEVAEGSTDLPDFNIRNVIKRFEQSFKDAAAHEKELVHSLIFGESRKQTELQTDLLAESKDQTATQKEIRDNVEKMANAEEAQQKKANLSAKERYLKSLAKDCLLLPLSAISDESATDDMVTLDQVYIQLDTTSTVMVDKNGKRITKPDVLKRMEDKNTRPLRVLEAASEHKKLVLLGDPGAGKSTFVKILCALLAQDKNPTGFEKGTLPVYIQLRDLAPKVAALKINNLPVDKQNDRLAAVLHEQIREELLRLEAEAYTDALCDAVRDGACLLVLDGLDEVPFDQRAQIHQTVLAIISKYSPRHIIVTCRIRSYNSEDDQSHSENHRLPGFEEYTIAKFDTEKIKQFVESWYHAQKDGKLTADKRKGKIARLTEAALSEELLEISANPMLLTTMAIIHQRDVELPDKRVQLYNLAVDVLVRRWRKHRTGEKLVLSEKLNEFLKDDLQLHPALERLAYEAHATERQNRKTGDLERLKALDILEDKKYLGDIVLAKEFLDYVDQKSGLLTGRGGELDKPVSYGFPHRTFQEYLAGCYLVGQRNAVWELMTHAGESNYWATAVQMGFEELHYNRRNENTLLDIAYRLCAKEETGSIAEERQHLWSANIAMLLGKEVIKADTIDPNGGESYLDRLRHSLVHLLTGSLPFEERAEAGRNLAKLGNEQELNALKIKAIHLLRKSPSEFQDDTAKSRLKELDFFVSDWHKEGKGCVHVYQTQKEGKVVMDYATGLMWEQSGSLKELNWKNAKEHIDQLNHEKFAGYTDWRLPTLEEAMSLMEREKKNGSLYIDPVFDSKQDWIWTADRYSASHAWYVSFYAGHCDHAHVDLNDVYARAVRS